MHACIPGNTNVPIALHMYSQSFKDEPAVRASHKIPHDQSGIQEPEVTSAGQQAGSPDGGGQDPAVAPQHRRAPGPAGAVCRPCSTASGMEETRCCLVARCMLQCGFCNAHCSSVARGLEIGHGFSFHGFTCTAAYRAFCSIQGLLQYTCTAQYRAFCGIHVQQNAGPSPVYMYMICTMFNSGSSDLCAASCLSVLQ